MVPYSLQRIVVAAAKLPGRRPGSAWWAPAMDAIAAVVVAEGHVPIRVESGRVVGFEGEYVDGVKVAP